MPKPRSPVRNAGPEAASRKATTGRGKTAATGGRTTSPGATVIAFTDSINDGFASGILDEQRRSSIEALLVAAIELFSEKGYHAATTREIAGRAGMSPAALYVHFRAKKDLLFQITEVMASAMLEDLRRMRDPEASAAERMRRCIKSYTRCNAHMHAAVHVTDFEHQALDGEQQAVVAEIRRQVRAEFADCLEAGRRSGEFEVPDPRIALVAIMSLCVSVSRWFSPDGRLTPEELGDLYADMILRMLRPDRTAKGSRRKSGGGPA